MSRHDVRVDPRAARSRARLAAAVLELASHRPIGEVTVAELASAADVNRSTFYQHASSPAALLRSVLTDELDAIRDEYLVDAGSDAAIGTALREVTTAVLAHVEEHAAIYLRGLGPESSEASLHRMLIDQFAGSAQLLIERHRIEVPHTHGKPIAKQLAMRYLAAGTVGAVEAWLTGPEPRSPQSFLDDYAMMLPPWWPLAD